MYLSRLSKRDLAGRWAQSDRIFFASGACHVLAWAFIRRHGGQAVWIKPAPGFIGNHVFVDLGDTVFDYHGYADRSRFLAHTWRRARRRWPGWDGELIALPAAVLVSQALSRSYEGLRLREPGQFHRDALPRAEAFVERFAAPARLTSRAGAAGVEA